jgi:TgpA N-terminal domain/Transglutaminase-like superfamily
MELAVVEIGRHQGDAMGSEARARIGLAALLVATLFCFELVFATGDYAGPALLGMALAGALVVVCRRIGLGALLTLTASTIGLVVYLCILFQARKTIAGLPTPGALEGLARAISNAMEASVVDFAPVPVRTGYVIMIVVGMWVVTTFGEVATFRWRTPLAASVGPISLVTVSLVVGTESGDIVYLAIFLVALFTYWSLESEHRLRSWGRWVGAFKRRRPEEPPSITGTIARRMGAATLLATLAAPVFLPGLGEGFLDWRGNTGSGPGSGVGGGEVNLLVDITPRLIEQSDSQLFTVRAEQGSYWRLASLVNFDGEQWGPLLEQEQSTERRLSYVDAVPDGRDLTQAYNISGLEGTNLPAATQPVEVSGVTVNAGMETGGIELAEGELSDDVTYEVTSEIPVGSYEDLLEAETGDLPEVGAIEYFETPALSPAVQDLADRWTSKGDTPLEDLVSIQENLRTKFSYSLDIAEDADTSVDYLEQFLLDTREGFCQQFATAFAVLAREAGYPTRVSVGFLPGASTPQEDGTFVYSVRGTDAHAWPEVYFNDYGWVAFEPTPRDDFLANEPIYTRPSTEGGGAGGIGDLASEDGAASGPENFRDINRDLSANPRRLRDPSGGGPAGLPLPAAPADDAPWRGAFTRAVLVLVLGVVAWILFVPTAKHLRITRRYRRALSPTATVAAAFAQFESEAAMLGKSRYPSESPSSFAERLAASDVVESSPARRLADLAERAEYSADGSDATQALESVRLARSLRRSMWSRASLPGRAAAVWSLRGLLSTNRRRGRERLLPASESA